MVIENQRVETVTTNEYRITFGTNINTPSNFADMFTSINKCETGLGSKLVSNWNELTNAKFFKPKLVFLEQIRLEISTKIDVKQTWYSLQYCVELVLFALN